MLKVNQEIDDLNRQVDERNMALYEIRQQTIRNTSNESIFSRNYTPTILKNENNERKTKAAAKNMKMGEAKPYCQLI